MFATENFVYGYPMVSKSFAWLSFQNFCDDVGVPTRELVMDGNQSEMGPKSKMRQLANKLHSQMRVTEPYSPWQNHVNDYTGIGEALVTDSMDKESTSKSLGLWFSV
jgi:hypothetical protein